MRTVMMTIFISCVWLANGLLCKVLGLVPRHQEIVARILDDDHAYILTKLIGIGEIMIVVWILSGILRRLCAIFQIFIVLTMNVIEFFLAPDLLLFGRFNFVVASLFCLAIFYQEFGLARGNARTT